MKLIGLKSAKAVNKVVFGIKEGARKVQYSYSSKRVNLCCSFPNAGHLTSVGVKLSRRGLRPVLTTPRALIIA